MVGIGNLLEKCACSLYETVWLIVDIQNNCNEPNSRPNSAYIYSATRLKCPSVVCTVLLSLRLSNMMHGMHSLSSAC